MAEENSTHTRYSTNSSTPSEIREKLCNIVKNHPRWNQKDLPILTDNELISRVEKAKRLFERACSGKVESKSKAVTIDEIIKVAFNKEISMCCIIEPEELKRLYKTIRGFIKKFLKRLPTE